MVLLRLLFLFDILLRTLRLKRRYPAIRWRDALLRRWIDLPLLLPFARLLRVVPVTERLSRAGLVQLEPLRAVISRGVVALLALAGGAGGCPPPPPHGSGSPSSESMPGSIVRAVREARAPGWDLRSRLSTFAERVLDIEAVERDRLSM